MREVSYNTLQHDRISRTNRLKAIWQALGSGASYSSVANICDIPMSKIPRMVKAWGLPDRRTAEWKAYIEARYAAFTAGGKRPTLESYFGVVFTTLPKKRTIIV
jgi:hypothetical protein